MNVVMKGDAVNGKNDWICIDISNGNCYVWYMCNCSSAVVYSSVRECRELRTQLYCL